MPLYLQHHEIDKQKWDACIEQAYNGTIYPYSWYLDIVSPYWDGLIDGDYDKVMPLPFKKKYGIPYLYPPLFTQQLGVFSREQLSDTSVSDFILAIPAKFKFIEANINAANNFVDENYEIIKRVNYELNLSQTHEQIIKNYNGDTKRNIKLAIKNGVKIIPDASVKEIIKIFSSNRGKDIGNIKRLDYVTLESLIHFLQQKNQVVVLGAFTKEGSLCAGAFFIHSHNRYIFIFSGTNDEAKKTGAIRLLIDRFIAEHCNQNLILDFEGSVIPGLAHFYQGFGSKESVYLRIKKNSLPSIIKWFKK